MRCSGVLLSAALVLLVAACDVVGGGARAVIELDGGEIRLDPGARAHEVRIGGAGATDSIVPAAVEVAPGDAVVFRVLDRRTHAIAFLADSLGADALAYLERTSQLRGPPLVNDESAWVVILRDAPPGRYPFLCRTHDAGGVVVVRDR